MALTSSCSVETQRAALHFLAAMCDKMELSRTVHLRILDALLQSMSNAYDVDYEKTSNLLLKKVSDSDVRAGINMSVHRLLVWNCILLFPLLQLLLSRLRLLHSLLPYLSPLPSLAVILSTLKANMAVGLPGQGKPSSMSSIQPPLAIPQSSLQAAPKSRPMHSVAGPQERRAQGKGKNRNKTKSKGESGSRTASDESGPQSSDSESSSSASEVSLSRWAGLDSADPTQKGKERSHGKRGVSSSEGEVSDSDTGSAKFKTVLSKMRHQALSCLTLIFQVG